MHVSLSVIRAIGIILCVLAYAHDATAVGVTQVIAVGGEVAPGDRGVFRTNAFDIPALNDLGQVAFRGAIEGPGTGPFGETGIFRGDAASTLVYVGLSGEAYPAINNAGQVAFENLVSSESSGTTRFINPGQPAPDGNGIMPLRVGPVMINDRGQVAFATNSIQGSIGGQADNRGVFLSRTPEDLVQIARSGQPAPDGDGVFSSFPSFLSTQPAINNAGQLVFGASLLDPSSGSRDTAIYLNDPEDGLVQIARRGQATPDGGVFVEVGQAASINEQGRVQFVATIAPTEGAEDQIRGLFISDGVSELTTVALLGQPAPDGNGIFAGFGRPEMNDTGQTAFFGVLSDTAGPGFSDTSGLFRSDGTTGVEQIVRAGDPAPDGNGVFLFVDSHEINNAGQVVFFGQLENTSLGSNDNTGIFLHDDRRGLLPVVREGQTLAGGRITRLQLNVSLPGDEHSGFNNHGQVAYLFHLDDGRSGIAVWSIPEPQSLSLLLAGAFGLLRYRSRRVRSAMWNTRPQPGSVNGCLKS